MKVTRPSPSGQSSDVQSSIDCKKLDYNHVHRSRGRYFFELERFLAAANANSLTLTWKTYGILDLPAMRRSNARATRHG